MKEVDSIKIRISGYFEMQLDGFDCSAFIFHNDQEKAELVYYDNKISNDGAVELLMDDLPTDENESDDFDEFVVDFLKASFSMNRIILALSIYRAIEIRANLSFFKKIIIDIIDYKRNTILLTTSICSYKSGVNAIELGQFVRIDNSWNFEVINKQTKGELLELVEKYC